jgi:hypothetical protein
VEIRGIDPQGKMSYAPGDFGCIKSHIEELGLGVELGLVTGNKIALDHPVGGWPTQLVERKAPGETSIAR